MEWYICPNCHAYMETIIETTITGTIPILKCPKCGFALGKLNYNFILNLGRRSADKVNGTGSDDVKAPKHASEKPPLGCAPYYVGISARICDLCEAIKRYSTAGGKHDKIKLWAYEILQLNEMDRNLRHEEKRKVWKEDKHGKLQEMP